MIERDLPSKIPILDEKDLPELTKQALKNNGVLATPQEISQMIINLPGVSIGTVPRSDGRYQGYIVDQNGRTYAYGKSVEEVAVKLKRYLQYGTPKKKKKENTQNGIPTTFTAFSMYYFENFRKKKVTEKTYYSDCRRFERYLKPYFKEKPLKSITAKDCQKLLDQIEESGKGKTVDEIYSLLNVILKIAIKHRLIGYNPLEIVFHVNHENKHGSALTKDEENKLKTSLKNSNLLPAFMILLYTGLRPNELASIKIENGFIIAVNSKRKHKRTEYKKIPISSMLAPFIPDVGNINLSSPDYLRRVFKDILPNHILYDLRTTFNSRCKECGISEHALKHFMGHSLGALGNAYTDLSDEYLIKEMAKFKY